MQVSMAKVEETSDATDMQLLGKDAEQQYISVLCMKQDEEAVLDTLKTFGFTTANFKDMKGTAAENISRLSERLKQLREEEKGIEEKFAIPAEEEDVILPSGIAHVVPAWKWFLER